MDSNYITYKGIPIAYQLKRKSVKNLNIRIHPSGKIYVSAPLYLPMEDITSFVNAKGNWIMRHLTQLEKIKARTDKEIYDGKQVWLLGKSYTLSIQETASVPRATVSIKTDTITIQTACPQNTEYLRQIYLKKLKNLAYPVFAELLDQTLYTIAAEAIQKPAFSIRNMKSIWGSCHIRQCKIVLNLQLVKAPKSCIALVILHELLHLRYPNHSASFYGALAQYMPDWKEKKEVLERQYIDGM